ncbi:hypothetical protein QOZ80_6AG0530230 [Eleusine coracana subsp. coracana]|nr:hypothetical protein QOZ80_6AG0530230 [Eleusine coracana subsp. coracana]
MASKVATRPAMAPAVLRLFFHDCFVNGCDASVLLDSTSHMESDKAAEPNDSLARLRHHQRDQVLPRARLPWPCADVIALASRDTVSLLGGPAWNVPLGRKDSRAANVSAADAYLSSPHANLTELLNKFATHGLDAEGKIIDPAFAEARRRTCHVVGRDDAVVPFDEHSPLTFDNAYYKDLVVRHGFLTSDQALYVCGGPFNNLVRIYNKDGRRFARDFVTAMVKMGNIPPLPGMPAEVRLNCKRINY